METGLYSDAAKFQLKPYLSNCPVTDEVFIERLSEAANIKQETQQKLRKTIVLKPPKVSGVQAEVSPPDSSAAAVDTVTHCEVRGKGNKSQGVKTETDPIEALKAEVPEIRKLILQTVGATEARPTDKTFTPSCSQPAQIVDSCRQERQDSFKWGQEGHLSRGCRRTKEQQGNETVLPSR